MLKLVVKAQNAIQAMKDESGQDLVEYSLIAALIAVACVVSMQGVATGLKSIFTKVTTDL